MQGVVTPLVGALALWAGTSVGPAGAVAAAPCRGSSLAAAFSAVPGSAGAGNIVYVLRVRNRTAHACFVSGQPRLVLLGRRGRALPTHPYPRNPGALTAVKVVLPPGAYASASARFSPDVPGPGESVYGPCEPTASRLRVTPQPGGGALVAPVVPPTPVCEHGGMELSVFVAGRNAALRR